MSDADFKQQRLSSRERLDALRDRAVVLAGSRGVLSLNALLFASTVAMLFFAGPSTLTGLAMLAWGALACYLAHHAGSTERLSGRAVVFCYAGGSAVLFLILQGLYRLWGA